MKKKSQKIKFVSGQQARKFKRELSWACDNKPRPVFQTLKFKLESEMVADFPRAETLYNTVEGTGKGSLTYLLFSLILCGFRIFQNATEAQIFASSSAYKEDEFKDAVKNIFGDKLPDFTPKKIRLNVIDRPPRKTNSKSIDFERLAIKDLCLSRLAPKNNDPFIDGFFQDIADTLRNNFSSWKEVKDSRLKAAELIDGVLKKRGAFPSLKEMFEVANVSLPKNSTIVFDNDLLIAQPDEELNPYIAIASILRSCDWKTEKNISDFVKKRLTTETNSGLSWFFNIGLQLLQTSPVIGEGDSLQNLYHVPNSKVEALEILKDAAKAIVPNKFLYSLNSENFKYHEFRSSFGGHIDSWVSNYINRLQELSKLIEKIPEKIELPQEFQQDGESFLEFAGLNSSEVEQTVKKFEEFKEVAEKSLNALCGRLDRLPTREDVEAIKSLSAIVNRLNAIRESLDNCMKQIKEDESSSWKELDLSRSEEWSVWEKLKLPKLNSLSGGVPKEEESLDKALKDFHILLECQKNDFDKVSQWAINEKKIRPFLEVASEKEAEKISKRPGFVGNAKEQAVRLFLNQIARIVRGRNDEVSSAIRNWFLEKQIFANLKDFNKFFYNSLGSLYVSPFTTRKHEGYALGMDDRKDGEGLFEDLKKFVNTLESTVVPFSQASMVLISLRRWFMNLRLSSISSLIPTHIAQLSLPENLKDALSDEAVVLLSQHSMEPSSYIKVFNTYFSLLNGLHTILRREKFYLRTKFSWIGNNSLMYVPKEKNWKIPERYKKSEGWQSIFSSGILVKTNDGHVDTLKTFEKIWNNSKRDDSKIKENLCLLQQLPHDWAYLSPITPSKNKYNKNKKVLSIRKKETKCSEIDSSRIMRLIGPSSYKSRLDLLLVSPERGETGDAMLLIDQPITQKLQGEKIILKKDDPICSLAVPISIKPPEHPDKTLLPFENVVAIDQGEAGLAYAVFNLNDFLKDNPLPFASGAIRIPSIRHLIKGVKRYRKGRQKIEKFSQKFDSTLFNRRENVTGDICHVIVGLMEKYKAFPILEFQVKNLESGSKQLSLVYKAVNSHFLYSDTDAQDEKRKQLWYGATGWTIPEIEREVTDNEREITDKSDDSRKEKVKKTKWKPLKVFPGVSVSAAYTSKICSCCGRNIGELLKEAEKEKCKQVEVKENGKVLLRGEKLQLFGLDKSKDEKYYRRRKQHIPLTQPLKSGVLSFSEFRGIVNRNLRRPQQSLQSKDTRQSRFFCVFEDCDLHKTGMHADENAAINIGRRFLKSLRRKK